MKQEIYWGEETAKALAIFGLSIPLPCLGYNKIKQLYRLAEEEKIKNPGALRQLGLRETLLRPEQLELYFYPLRATTYAAEGGQE